MIVCGCRTFLRLLALCLCWTLVSLSIASAPRASEREVVGFSELLAEAGLTLEAGEQFVEDVPPRTPLYSFQKALRHQRLPLKVYYAVRPLSRMRIDYEDPHSNAPDPNHIFPMVFQALVGRLARPGATPSHVYPRGKAKELFNADWAAAAIFDTEPELGSGYGSALLVALHKNHRADAYILAVFDDAKAVKPAIDSALRRFRFSDPR